jgi:uncharacterized protein (TIRG00374 family)
MGKLVVGLVLLLGVFFVINNFTQGEEILGVIEHGDWRYFAAAVAAQALWIIASAATYWAVFRALGIQRKLAGLIPLAAASNFINVIAPSGGMSGLAVLMSEARRSRLSSARAAVAGALVVLSEYAGFTFFLVTGLVVLFRRGDLSGAELAATGFLFFSAAILATLLYLGMKSAKALGRALKWMARLVNRVVYPFIKREYLSEENAEHFAHDAAEGLVQLKKQPAKLLLPVLFSLISKGLLLFVLLLMFEAFQVEFTIGVLFAAFAIAYLFVIVSPTPAGVGVVEGLLTLTLVSLFIPVEEATVVVLGYRAVTFWLPLLFGMLSFQLLHLKKPAAA